MEKMLIQTVKLRKLKKLTFLAFYSLVSPIYLVAQTVIEHNFDSHFLAYNQQIFANTEPYLHLEGDSIVNLSFNKAGSGRSYAVERWHYRFNNQMQIVDSFQVWNRTSPHRPALFEEGYQEVDVIQNGANDSLYYFEVETLNDSTADIRLHAIDNQLKKVAQVFGIRRHIIGNVIPYVFDTTLTLIIGDAYPEASIHQYSLNTGSLLKEDTNFQFNSSLFLYNVIEVIPNPDNLDEIFLFQEGSAYCLSKINWRTQTYIKTYDQPNNKVDDSLVVRYQLFSEQYYDVLIEDSSSFKFIGKHQRNDIPPTGNNYSYQLAVHQISSLDSLLSIKDYGDSTAGNDLSGYVLKKYNQTDYLVGRTSQKDGFYLRYDTFQLALFIEDSNRRDSIYFMGGKNHRPVDLKVNSLGDVYISSVYSKQNSNHEVFVTLIKIPHTTLSLIQEFQPNRKLYLYPNPTKGMLKFDNMSQAKEIQLLSQDGKLLKSYSSQQDFIDLNEFAKGVYLVRAIFKDQLQTGIVIKE